MFQPSTVEKVVGAYEIRRSFGRLIQSVLTKGEKYIIERHGEPVAAVVPLGVYEQWKQNRTTFFNTLRQSQQVNLSAEAANILAREAVQVIRAGNKDENSP